MRYLSMILSAGLLLSVGILAGSGPAHAAVPTLASDRSAVADTAVKRLPTTTDNIAVPIAVAITATDMAMATTTSPIMVMATDAIIATRTLAISLKSERSPAIM